MNKRDIGKEILDGIFEIRDFKKGHAELMVSELSEPSKPKVIRAKLKLSQSAFAGLLGVSIRTLQDWEQRAQGSARASGSLTAHRRATS